MSKFLVNYNIYGTVEIDAKDEDDARNKAYLMSKGEILEHVEDEINSGSFDVGTIEQI